MGDNPFCFVLTLKLTCARNRLRRWRDSFSNFSDLFLGFFRSSRCYQYFSFLFFILIELNWIHLDSLFYLYFYFYGFFLIFFFFYFVRFYLFLRGGFREFCFLVRISSWGILQDSVVERHPGLLGFPGILAVILDLERDSRDGSIILFRGFFQDCWDSSNSWGLFLNVVQILLILSELAEYSFGVFCLFIFCLFLSLFWRFSGSFLGILGSVVANGLT